MRTAHLVALDGVLLRGEEVACVEIAIAQKFEGGAMKSIGPRAGHNVDHGAAGAAVPRVKVVGLHGELRQGVRIGEAGVEVVDVVLVRCAIQLVAHLVPHRAVGRDGEVVSIGGVGGGIGAFADYCAGRHVDQRSAFRPLRGRSSIYCSPTTWRKAPDCESTMGHLRGW